MPGMLFHVQKSFNCKMLCCRWPLLNFLGNPKPIFYWNIQMLIWAAMLLYYNFWRKLKCKCFYTVKWFAKTLSLSNNIVAIVALQSLTEMLSVCDSIVYTYSYSHVKKIFEMSEKWKLFNNQPSSVLQWFGLELTAFLFVLSKLIWGCITFFLRCFVHLSEIAKKQEQSFVFTYFFMTDKSIMTKLTTGKFFPVI